MEVFKATKSRFALRFLRFARHNLQILQNAERRMMVSGIECETGRYIIYDKLISYMPNPNPNPNPNP